VKKKLLLLIATFGVAIGAASFNFGGSRASATVPGTNSLISVKTNGVAASIPNGFGATTISANGRYALFVSGTNGIVSTDNNNNTDTFVRDLDTNTTSLVDVSTNGVQANQPTGSGEISETGRYIVFDSTASNLIDGTTISSSYLQTYVRDTYLGTTALISKNTSGDIADHGTSSAAISSDGRFVLLSSNSTNLGAPSNGQYNLYMLDRSDGSYTVLNTKLDGSFITSSVTNTKPSMSCDGSLVAFQYQPGLTSSASSTSTDIYLLDRRANNKLTDITASANHFATTPFISCRGDYIGFASAANNLDPTITIPTADQGFCHAYVYDRILGISKLVEQSSTGTVGNTNKACSNSNSVGPFVNVSDNGIAVFDTYSTNLVVTPPSHAETYIRNLKTGITELLSQNSSGAAANNDAQYPAISADGKMAIYGSASTNLSSTSDTNNAYDAFTSLTGY